MTQEEYQKAYENKMRRIKALEEAMESIRKEISELRDECMWITMESPEPIRRDGCNTSTQTH